jgi:3-dehydroquinate synthase
MADSAIGGKVAVNHPWAKNVIGAFHQPKFVFVDFDFLRTLSKCEFLCGLAEVAKYGLAVDRSFFTWLRKNMPGLLDRGQVVEEAIRQSCRLKARIVAQDEKDTGKRMILNFGHTFGHALECVGEYKAIKHGEAVWLGMLAASHMSFQTGLMDDDDFEEILMTLRPPLHRIGANPRVRKFVQSWSLRGAVKQMNSDKKSRRGLRHVVLLRGIGKAAVFQWSDDAQLQRSLEWMKAMVDKRTSHE